MKISVLLAAAGLCSGGLGIAALSHTGQGSAPPSMQAMAVEADQSLLADAAAKRQLRSARAGHWRVPGATGTSRPATGDATTESAPANGQLARGR